MIGLLDSVLFCFSEIAKRIDWWIGIFFAGAFLVLLFSDFVSGNFGVIQIGFYCSIGKHSIILLFGWWHDFKDIMEF